MSSANVRMRQKPGRRAAAAVRNLADDDGLFGRLADWVLANPVRSGGILVVLLTTIAIIANAVFFQSGRHPSPFFTTRPNVVAAVPVASAKGVPVPKSRGDVVEPERVRSERLLVPPRDSANVADDIAVLQVQDELAARGLYDGKADGVLGAKTRAAIAAYERKYGLPETGLPSDGLIAHMRRTTALDETAMVSDPAPAPATRDDRVVIVQEALNAIGYGPLQVTGGMTRETADSIRRFELDNGMPITGEANPDFIRKLVAIGAIAPD